MSNMIAAQVHRIPHHVLAQALPQMRPFDHHTEIRMEFIRFIGRRPYATWQDAWNDWTRATPGRPGRINLTVVCPECHGRMFSTRALTRGVPGGLCTRCHGRRRIHLHSAAMWLQPPESDPT